MCCQSFWKGVVVFCLAFGLSVFVAGFFSAKDLPIKNIQTTMILAPAVSNCVPVDKNLKYETLPLVEPDFESVKKVDPRSPDKKNKVRELDKKAEKKNDKKAEQQFYDPSKDSAEYKTLLHKEQCFETQEPK